MYAWWIKLRLFQSFSPSAPTQFMIHNENLTPIWVSDTGRISFSVCVWLMCFINPPPRAQLKSIVHTAVPLCILVSTCCHDTSPFHPEGSLRYLQLFRAEGREPFTTKSTPGTWFRWRTMQEKKEKKGRKNKHVCTPGAAFSQQSLTLRLCLPKGNIHTYFHTWVQTEAEKVDERGVALHYYRWRYVIKT